MIKNSLKIYFTSFKYFWIPLVFILGGLGIGSLIVYFGARNQIEDLLNKVKNMANGASLSINDMIAYLIAESRALPWNNFLDLIRVLFKENWLLGTIEKFFSTAVDDYAAYKDAIKDEILASYHSMLTYYVIFFSFLGVGLLGGYFLTGSLIRKKWAPKSIWRALLVAAIDFVLSAGMVALIGYVTSLWTPAVYISSIISAVLFALLMVIKAYFAQKDDSIKFKDVMNIKLISLVLLMIFLLFLISAGMLVVVFLLLMLIPYKQVTVLILLAFAYVIFLITSIAINILAEAEVYRMKKA